MSPIMRPPPLPSIPRQAPAAATTRATDHHHSSTTSVSTTTKHTDPQKLSDCDGRGASLTPASTDTSASVGKATGLTVARQGDRNNIAIIGGGGRMPEANASSSSGDKNRDDDDDDNDEEGGVPFPTARAPAAGKAEAASVAHVDEAAATAAAATGSGALSSAKNPLAMGDTKTSATKTTPTELNRTPRDSSSSRSQEKTAAEAAAATRAPLNTAAAADTSERPGALRGVAGPRQQARVAGKATTGVSRSSRGRSSTSKDSLSTTTGSADIAGGERGPPAVSTVATVPSGMVEHSPRYGAGGASGTAVEVAPAGSLVRLKRRQQARTRLNSQR